MARGIKPRPSWSQAGLYFWRFQRSATFDACPAWLAAVSASASTSSETTHTSATMDCPGWRSWMRRSPPPWPNPGRPLGSSSVMRPAVVAMSRSVRRRSSCRRPSMPSFLHVRRWCDDKAGAWLVVEHTHRPVGILFWSGRRSHRRRLIRISAVVRDSSGKEGNDDRNADAPGLACESSWARSRVGISE